MRVDICNVYRQVPWALMIASRLITNIYRMKEDSISRTYVNHIDIRRIRCNIACVTGNMTYVRVYKA